MDLIPNRAETSAGLQTASRPRLPLQSVTSPDAPRRNEQFENIARLKEEYLESRNPIISMDSKTKAPVENSSAPEEPVPWAPVVLLTTISLATPRGRLFATDFAT
ncbi:MAG TPA: hypothetical protein EYP04_04915 [Anaerolineae bacterium]|nr:hypothetical protein [Anaerolineae bacterium]